ncbi:MAG: hypothetical protein AAGE98_12900 [Actinomycetota bacterium]
MRELLLDLLLPETDRGAVIQIVVATVVWAVVLAWSLRWRREYRIFAVGLAVLTYAWFGARAIH